MKTINKYDIVKNKQILIQKDDGSFEEVTGLFKHPKLKGKFLKVKDSTGREFTTHTLRAFFKN